MSTAAIASGDLPDAMEATGEDEAFQVGNRLELEQGCRRDRSGNAAVSWQNAGGLRRRRRVSPTERRSGQRPRRCASSPGLPSV
jgi:hypothetical protein